MDKDQTIIKVKLIPRSSRNQIIGKDGDVFKVKVTSPPVEGLANKALIELFAKRIGVPKGSIDIISGKSSRRKSLRIDDLSLKEVTERLEI